ncbi:MAG TPA: SCO family protein [bacterium]|jgi:protein SCO1/2|nr:SCO family protein [bacterium]
MSSVESTGLRPGGEAFLIRTLQVLAVAGVLVAGGLALRLATAPPDTQSGLPRMGQVPPFQLVEAGGKPFFSQSLSGKVWIASFVYTTCKSSCPMLTAQMHRLSKSLPAGPDFALLSFTVDPKKDTPEVLEKYARATGADDPRWHFLTGELPALKSLIMEGFKIAVATQEKASDARLDPDIIHSTRLVLVDRHGVIRGYYDGLLGSSIDDLKRDSIAVSKEVGP